MSPDEVPPVTFLTLNTLRKCSHDGGETERPGTDRTPLNAAFVSVCVWTVLYTDAVSGHTHAEMNSSQLVTSLLPFQTS